MTCEALAELVTDYLEGALPAADRAKFDWHLSVCPECRTYLDQMRKVVATLGKLPNARLPAAVEAKLLEQFRDWKRERPPE